MAERDFVQKLERAGFEGIEILDRKPWGIAECALYPLFDDTLISLMKQVIPVKQQDRIGDSIVIIATLGSRNAPVL